MIKYILENKEWIFSGVGVTAILIVRGWLFKHSSSSPPSAQSHAPPIEHIDAAQTPNLPAKSTQLAPEVANIVKRFNEVLNLMNEKRSFGQYTIASLAQLMKLHSVGELQSVFIGSREPSFGFIEHFSVTFGVNKNWLIEGIETPFIVTEKTRYDPLDYLDEIKALTPNRLYFIRSTSEIGEAFLLFKFSD